jgi:quinate dehydrogenase (quinone)
MPILGGLLFFAATLDHCLRVNTNAGEELWKARLPVGSQPSDLKQVIGHR